MSSQYYKRKMMKRKAVHKSTIFNAKKLLLILNDRDKALKDLSQKIDGLLESRHRLQEMYADIVRKIRNLNEYSAVLPITEIKADRPLLRMAITQEIKASMVSPESVVFQQLHYELMDWITFDISNDNIMRRAMIFKLISNVPDQTIYFQYNDPGLAALEERDIVMDTHEILVKKWRKIREGR